jgi:hypothetical protein
MSVDENASKSPLLTLISPRMDGVNKIDITKAPLSCLEKCNLFDNSNNESIRKI